MVNRKTKQQEIWDLRMLNGIASEKLILGLMTGVGIEEKEMDWQWQESDLPRETNTEEEICGRAEINRGKMVIIGWR